MSAPTSIEIFTGYRVEPADNGGWILWDNTPPECKSRVLGAFTSAADLLNHLHWEHQHLEVEREARAKQERAAQLGLEEHVDSSAVDQWTPEEQATIAGREVPANHWRVIAYASKGNETFAGDYSHLGAARTAALVRCDANEVAYVYNDQGECILTVKP